LLSSYAAQFNFLKFVEDGPTDRLKTFKDICDLNFFDDIVEKTKDDYKVLKKTIDKTDYRLIIAQQELGINTLKEDLEKIEQVILDNQTRVELQEHLILDANSALIAFQGKGLEGLDTKTLRIALSRAEVDLGRLRNELGQSITKEESLKEQCAEYAQRISSFDRGFLKEQIKELESDERQLRKIETDSTLLQREIQNDSKTMETVQSVPCKEHETYPYECPYVAEAAKLFETVENKAQMLERLILDGNDYRAMVADKKKFKKQLDDFNILEIEWNGMRKELESARGRIKDKTALINQAEEQIKELESKIQRAEEEKDIIENYEMKKLELQTLRNVLLTFKKELQQSYFERDKINYSIKSYGEMILDCEFKIKKQFQNTETLQAFEHYLTAIDGKTGLPMEIIRKLLPYINNEIAVVLSGMDDLKVYFDVSSSDSIEIYLKDNDGDEPRTISMGSGYEKQMTSVAIRMALLEVMKMAHCDTIFLDEPATALDSDHLLEFGKLIELLKRKFSKIYLITHMEFLKDIVDFSFDIQTDENGYARILD
jgi:DNA repair exonuclease SbcCD ATPase subunit